MKRTGIIEWNDPLEGFEQGQKLSGFDYLKAMQEGEIPLPPLLKTLDFQMGSLEKGKVTLTFQPQEFHYNPIGVVHGGVITSILDSAMGCALHSTLDAGVGYTTLELKVNFLRAVTLKQSELQAIGKVIHAGKRIAMTEAQLVDTNKVIYAHAVSTCMILQ